MCTVGRTEAEARASLESRGASAEERSGGRKVQGGVWGAGGMLLAGSGRDGSGPARLGLEP